jgi:crossover junction endodeoxyribonuclease RuvC
MILLAVDPGKSGALAWLKCPHGSPRAELLQIMDMPTRKHRTKTTLDVRVLAAQIRDAPFPNLAIVEKVGAMPGQGVTSMFDFGFSTGGVHGCLAGHGILITDISPQEWRSWAQLRGNKSDALGRASELFPEFAKSFSRKKDHGRAEAALIGYAAICRSRNQILNK